MNYGHYGARQKRSYSKKWLFTLVIFTGLSIGGYCGYKYFTKPTIEEAIESQLIFDDSFTSGEKQIVSDAIKNQSKNIDGITTANAETVLATTNISAVLNAYVPVTNVYSPKQLITKEELATTSISIWHEIEDTVSVAIANTLGVEPTSIKKLDSLEDLSDTSIAIIPAGMLSYKVKLLNFDDSYYLDSFTKGAIFRQVKFTGDSAINFADLVLNKMPGKETTLKVNQTGVTALTRVMMKKLNTVSDPLYFSEKIGDFLADADITHVSNEVSFKADCGLREQWQQTIKVNF